MFRKLNLALIAVLIALPAVAGQQLGRDSVYAFGKRATTPVTMAVTFKPGRA